MTNTEIVQALRDRADEETFASQKLPVGRIRTVKEAYANGLSAAANFLAEAAEGRTFDLALAHEYMSDRTVMHPNGFNHLHGAVPPDATYQESSEWLEYVRSFQDGHPL